MTEVERLEYVISADNSKAVTAFQETGKAYEQMDSKLSSSSSSQFGTNIASGANTAKGAIGTLSGAVDTLGNKLKGISAGQAFSAIESGASKASRAMQGIGIAATAVGVPVGLLAKNSLTAFADLESQTQRNTALLGGSKAEYEEILALSKELGASTPFDALEIGSGIESLAAAGYSLKEIQSAMPTVAEMAIATGEDLGAMSEILIATLNSYGEGAEMAATYGDKLATVSNQSSASITDFGESMKYVGAVADSFGVDINELGGAIGVLADNNLKGSIAGTGLREIITTLANPTAKVKDLFESFGLSMDELNPKTQNFVDILAKMRDAGVSDEALMGAFGDRAGPAALILTKNVEELRKQYDTLLNDSEGMLKEFSSKMRDTLSFVMGEMGGTISNILIEIGAGLKPIVQEMGAWLNENQQSLIDFARNAVEGLTPFVKKFMDLAKGVMDWFNSLPKDMQGKIAGLTGLGAAMATIGGPLLLLGSLPVAAIGNIAGVLKGLFEIKGTSAIGAGVATLVTSLKQLSGITAIKDVAQYLVPIGPAAAGAAGEVGLLTSALATLGGPIGAGAIVAVAAGLAAYTTNFGDFRDNINAIISDLGSAASNIASGDFEAAGRDCAEAFSKGLEAAWDVSVATIGSLPEIDRAISEMKSGFDKAAYEMSKGFADQLTSTISGLTIGLPHLLFTEEGKKELTDSIKAAVASIDLSAEGTLAMRTFASAFTGLDTLLQPAIAGIFDSFQESYNNLISSLPDLPGLAQYKQYLKDTNEEAEESKRKYGLNNPETAKLDFTNYNYDHNSTQSNTAAAGKSAAQILSEEREIRLEDAQKMLDSSDATRQKYEEQASAQDTSTQAITAGTEAVEGFTQAVNEAATAKTKTAAEIAVDETTAQLAKESKGGGDSYDLFSGDPAAYLENELKKDLDLFYEGSLNNLIQDYQNHGKTLQDKLHAIYQEGKYDSGYGGNESEWMAKASPAVDNLSRVSSSLGEVGTGGNLALTGLSPLPASLQNIAGVSESVISRINAVIKSANDALATANSIVSSAQTTSQPRGGSGSAGQGSGVTNNVYISGNTYGKSTDPGTQAASFVTGLRARGF